MMDIVFWIATIVAIALGILLIGIEFYEDWSLNSQVTEDASDAPRWSASSVGFQDRGRCRLAPSGALDCNLQ